MLKSIKFKKGANLALITAVLIVWSLIGSYLYQYFSSGKESESVEITIPESMINILAESPQNDTSSEKLPALSRNPFRFSFNQLEKPVQNILPPAPKLPLFRFQLQGIILRQGGRTAVIDDETNKRLVYLKEGESYLDLTITRITAQEIVYLQNGSTLTAKPGK